MDHPGTQTHGLRAEEPTPPAEGSPLPGPGGHLGRDPEQLLAIIDSMPLALIMADTQGLIVLANAQAERQFGYSKGELLGAPVEQLLPERYRAHHPTLRAGYAHHPQARPMGAGRDLHGLHRDGTEFPIEIGLNPVHTADGVFIISAIVDISERRRLAVLERSNAELTRFAYLASHDLQTPLRSIASFAELLQTRYGGQLDERAHDWIRRMIKAVAHLRSLLRDLLEYARVDAQTRPLQWLDFNEIYGQVRALLETALHDSGATLSSDALPQLYGDPIQLSQLLLNLIDNSLKYRGPAPPLIHLSVQAQGDHWLFTLSDNGIGIAAQHHDRIFELFQRLSETADGQGTGIGLAICRRVVHRHGGRLWVQSSPGQGSSFQFTLPRQAPKDTPA